MSSFIQRVDYFAAQNRLSRRIKNCRVESELRLVGRGFPCDLSFSGVARGEGGRGRPGNAGSL